MSEAKGDPLSRSLCPFSVKNAFIKKAPIQNNRIGAYAQSLFDVDNFNVEGQVFSGQRMVGVKHHDLVVHFDDLHFHVAVIGGDLKHHAHFGLDVFGDFAHGHFHEEFFQMLPIRLIGGNGNRETVARVVSEQRILKTGDQASVAMVNSRGSRSLEESNTSPSEKVPG